MKDSNSADDFIERFHKHLSQVDQIAQLVLKGHLEVEAELDDFLKAIFFHPEVLQDARLTFFQKTQIARAYAIRKSNWPQWKIILGLNSLRNSIAHGHETEKRKEQLNQLRRDLSEFGTDQFGEEVRNATEERLVVFAAAVSSGFFLDAKDEVIALRQHIDKLDEKLNPDKPRVPIQSQPDDDK